MDLSKVYYDGDGNELNILQIVKLSPEWAANRIQEGEKAIANMVRLTLDKGIKYFRSNSTLSGIDVPHRLGGMSKEN